MTIENKIARRIHIDDSINKVIIGIGPVRSGTTLFLRIFAQLGIHTWYQPLKAIYRGYLHNNEVDITITDDIRGPIFIKETLGPYTKTEASINSLNVLLKAGVAREKIKLITLVRDPYTTIASSVLQFSKFEEREDVVDISLKSYDTIYTIQQFAKDEGIETSSFVYESWSNNDPLDVLEKLFSNLAIPIERSKLLSWKSVETLEEISNLHITYEPSFYHYTDFSERVKNSGRISFYSKTEGELKKILSPAQIKSIKNSSAISIYKHFRRQTELDLNIKVNKLRLFCE